MLRRLPRANGLYSISLVIVLISALLVAVGWGRSPDRWGEQDLIDSTIWVTSPAAGLVHPIDATVGRPGPPMQVSGGIEADLETVQAGSNGYVLNRTTGSIRFIDAAQRIFGPANNFDLEGLTSFLVNDSVGWVYFGAPTHRLQRVSPGPDLVARGDLIPVVADGDDGALQSSGAILMPNQEQGKLTRVPLIGAQEEVEVAPAGNDLVARVVDDLPVVIDVDAKTVVSLDDDLNEVRTCTLPISGTPRPATGEGTDGRLAMMVPEQGALLVLDLETCDVRAPQAGSPGDEFGQAVTMDGLVFVPNFTQSRAQIVEVTGSFGDEGLSSRPSERLNGTSGRFELIAENGMVVFNDRNSDVVGMIDRSGAVRQTDKFGEDLGGDGGDFNLGDEEEPAGGSDGVQQTTETEEEVNPDDEEEPPTEEETEQEEPQVRLPGVRCESDPRSIEAGDEITVVAQPSTVGDVEIQSYQFTFPDGSVVPDDDGTWSGTIPETSDFEIGVRGVTSSGTTRLVGCGVVAVGSDGGDDRQPDPELACYAEEGREAQVDTDVTFQAQFGDEAPTGFQWTFDDGEVTRETAPTRQFADAQDVAVELEVTYADGGTDRTSCGITITAGAPDLSPSFRYDPPTVTVDQPVDFFSNSNNPEAILRYEWEFEDGSPSTWAERNATGVTFSSPGLKLVRLTIYNADNQPFPVEEAVMVQPEGESAAPEVRIDPIPNLFVGQTMNLNYQLLAGGDIRSAEWVLSRTTDTGTTQEVARLEGNGQSFTIPTHTGGRYTIRLTVTDEEGRIGTDTETSEVFLALNPDFTISANPTGRGSDVTFVGSASSSAIDTWRWDFGDGNSATGQTARHAYASEGTFTVRLTVELRGATESIAQDIQVLSGNTQVPDVVGQTEQAATASIERESLVVASSRECRVGIEADRVAEQNPVGGTFVNPNSTVSLVVGDGTQWRVPDIQPTDTPATHGLEGRLVITLQAQETADTTLHGTKVSQSENVGTEFCGQQTVNVVVWGPPPPLQLSCTADVQFGNSASCMAEGNLGGGTIDWGDGSTASMPAGGTLNHTYGAAGNFTPVLTDGGDTDSSAVMVRPVVSAPNCSSASVTVYTLVSDPDLGWDYSRDGEGNILPPATVGGNTSCSVTVAGGSGSVSWSWSGPFGSSTNGSGVATGDVFTGQWGGHQSGTVTFTATVNGATSAPQRAPLYAQGCG